MYLLSCVCVSEEGLVPLLMGLPGDLQTSASMLYDDEV
jgi:hypothetical protein